MPPLALGQRLLVAVLGAPEGEVELMVLTETL